MNPTSVLVRAYMDERGSMPRRSRHLLRAADTAEPSAVASLRALLAREGVPLSFDLIQRWLVLGRSRRVRKGRGIVYTPRSVVETICAWSERLHREVGGRRALSEWRVFDPAVGAGAFLLGMAEYLHRQTGRRPSEIISRQLFGADISRESVATTELLLHLWAFEREDEIDGVPLHLRIGNSLSGVSLHEAFGVAGGFDAVIGNPPYVRIQNMTEAVRRRVRERWRSARSGNIDLYVPFIELGLQEIGETGIVGYIVPSTFTTTDAGRPLRELLAKRGAIIELYDFDHHQMFEDVTTYACLLFLTARPQTHLRYAKATTDGAIPEKPRFARIAYARLNAKRWQLVEDAAYPVIRALESAGRPLGRIARIGVGLATLADSCYLLTGQRDPATGHFIKQVGAKRYLIEPAITRRIIKASAVKSEADVENSETRILFPYRCAEGKHEIVHEAELRERFPNAYSYLRSIRDRLDARDRGKRNRVAWYAFGRSQGIASNFGPKLLTAGLNRLGRFVMSADPEATFYGGYCVQTQAEDLRVLEKVLNSPLLDFYIHQTSRSYQHGYKSFAKSFLQSFSVPNLSASDRAALLAETDPERFVAFLLARYGLCLADHRALAEFIAASPKMEGPLPAYPPDGAEYESPSESDAVGPQPRLFR